MLAGTVGAALGSSLVVLAWVSGSSSGQLLGSPRVAFWKALLMLWGIIWRALETHGAMDKNMFLRTPRFGGPAEGECSTACKFSIGVSMS